jgi:hypothetical protein
MCKPFHGPFRVIDSITLTSSKCLPRRILEYFFSGGIGFRQERNPVCGERAVAKTKISEEVFLVAEGAHNKDQKLSLLIAGAER